MIKRRTYCTILSQNAITFSRYHSEYVNRFW